MATIHELYEKKKAAYSVMEEVRNAAQDDQGWTDERKQQFDAASADLDGCDAEIRKEEEAQEREERFQAIQDFGERQTHGDNTTRGEMQAHRSGRLPGWSQNQIRSAAMLAWFRPALADDQQRQAAKLAGVDIHSGSLEMRAFFQPNETNPFERQMPECAGGYGIPMKRYLDSYMETVRNWEQRQQGTTPDAAGGYTVPEGMMQAIEIALKMFGAPRRYSSVVRAGNGRTMPWPTVNDTAVLGERIAENAAANQGDITFGQASTTPALYSSKYVPVSIQLMQDSNENMDALVGQLLGERIGRIQSNEFTVNAGDGTAANGPIGLVATNGAADSGITLATANNPTYGELMDVKGSVDPAYTMMGQGWTFANSVLTGIKKIETNNGPLWRPGLAAGIPNTIDGDPYYVNQDMPTGSSGKCIAYGQLDKYKIHDATDMIFRRLDELHALNHQVTFLAFMRSNGLLLDAGTNPVKYASNPV